MERRQGSNEARRPVVYCVVPRDLAAKLHERLRRHFHDDPHVEVIVERRAGERREVPDRRSGTGAMPAVERRRIASTSGRRVADQRTPVMAVEPPPLPRSAQRYRARLTFFERVEPVPHLVVEDEDTERLLARIQAGERELFSVVYDRYFSRVYSYMRVVFGNAGEAEDATQQVFVRVLEALPRYVSGSKPFRAWLFVVARNLAIDQLRASRRLSDADVVDAEEPASPELPTTTFEALEWISDRELHLFIERLPLAQQRVLILRYGFGFSTNETAAILGESPGTIRKQHSRALAFLRERLTAVGRGSGDRRRTGAERPLRRSLVLRRRRFSMLSPR